MTGLKYSVTGISHTGKKGAEINLYGIRVFDSIKRELVFELADITDNLQKAETFAALCIENHIDIFHIEGLIEDFFWR